MHTATDAPPAPGAAVIRLRLDRFGKLMDDLGLATDGARAAYIGIDRTTYNRVRRGETIPGERFIAGCVAAFPEVRFEYLFALEAA